MSTASGGMGQLNGSGYLDEVSPAARVSVPCVKKIQALATTGNLAPWRSDTDFTKDVPK